jgi:membrane protein DedA with SNARE-associated domain/rhodanese-related sulfurtransferase
MSTVLNSFVSFTALSPQDDTLLVFVNVFLQQIGTPIPSVPTMMVAASKAVGWLALLVLLGAAVTASVLADWIWYRAGKLFGYRVLSLLCKLSINPSSCVNQTEARFGRWGVWSLVVGKFIPGFSTVAPPVAGALGMPLMPFLIASAVGAALWAGLALLAGYAFAVQIAAGMDLLSRYGVHAAGIALGCIALVLGWKYWRKHRFGRMAKMRHVSIEELRVSLQSATPPHLLDLRSAALIAETQPIAGAHVTSYEAITASLQNVAKDYPIITICACPQDAGAVKVAHELQALGYENAFPLRGGYETWLELNADGAPEFAKAS